VITTLDFSKYSSCIRNWRNTLLKIYLRNIVRSGICGATLDGKMILFSWQVETCFMHRRWNRLSCDIQQFSGLSLGVTEGIGNVYSCNWPTMWPRRQGARCVDIECVARRRNSEFGVLRVCQVDERAHDFSDPARPFRRSGKDSLLRRGVLALYMILMPCICMSTLVMSLC
jgi:hypothetical protein